jgi:hypothetical protein
MNENLQNYIAEFDSGIQVQSVLMGGIGYSYESAIQHLVIETLRILQSKDFSVNAIVSGKTTLQSCVYEIVSQIGVRFDKQYGYSVAQVGAAANLAFIFWKKSPMVAIEDMYKQDRSRIIMIEKGMNGGVIICSEIIKEMKEQKKYPEPKFKPYDKVLTHHGLMIIDIHVGHVLVNREWIPKYICLRITKKFEIDRRTLRSKTNAFYHGYLENQIAAYTNLV